MNQLTLISDIIWYVSTAVGAALLASLFQADLARRYRALAIYLTFSTLRSVALITVRAQLRLDSNLYAYLYVLSSPLVWLASLYVSLEIYHYVFEAYQGLRALSRKSILWTFLASSFLAFLYIAYIVTYSGEESWILRSVFAFEQAVALTIFFALLALAAFLAWYPVPLRRNVLVYSFGFSGIMVFFMAGTSLRFFAGPVVNGVASIITLGLFTLVTGAWLVWLRPAGEQDIRAAGFIPRTAEDRQRLLNQLAEMNAMLEAGRRQRP